MMYLTQNAQSNIYGGKQSPEGRRNIWVKCRSSETQHKQDPIFCQVHALRQIQTKHYYSLCLFNVQR